MVEAEAGPGAGIWEGSRPRGLAAKVGPGFEFRPEADHFTTMSFSCLFSCKKVTTVRTCQGWCEITQSIPITVPPTLGSTRSSSFTAPMTGIGLIGSEALCDKIPHVTLESGQPTLEPWPHHSLQQHLGRFWCPAEPDLSPLQREKASPVRVKVAQPRTKLPCSPWHGPPSPALLNSEQPLWIPLVLPR